MKSEKLHFYKLQILAVPPLTFVSMVFGGKGIDWRAPLYISNRYPCLKNHTNKS